MAKKTSYALKQLLPEENPKTGKIDYILQQRFAIAKLLRKNDECLQFPPV